MDELDRFLQQARDQGSLDSDGGFTLSLQAAQEKLQRHVLVRPELYIVELVAAAVASEASFLRIAERLAGLEFVFDGQAPTSHELTHLSAALLASVQTRPALTSLALAAWGASTSLASGVIITSYTADETWELELRGSEQRVRSLAQRSPVVPLVRVLVEKNFGLATRLTQRHPERSELVRCRYAPLTLTWQGEVLVQPELVVPPDLMVWAELLPAAGHDSRCRSPFAPWQQIRWPGVSGYLGLGRRSSAPGQLVLLHHGVETVHGLGALGPPGLEGVVMVSDLQRDLSRLGLVQSAQGDHLFEELGRLGWSLLVHLCSQPGVVRPHWAALWPQIEPGLGQLDPDSPWRPLLQQTRRLSRLSEAYRASELLRCLSEAEDLQKDGHPSWAAQLRGEIMIRAAEMMQRYLQGGATGNAAELAWPLAQAARDADPAQRELADQVSQLVRTLSDLSPPPLPDPWSSEGWSGQRWALLLWAAGQYGPAQRLHQGAIPAPDPELRAFAYKASAELSLLEGDRRRAEEQLAAACDLCPQRADWLLERALLWGLMYPASEVSVLPLLQRALPSFAQEPRIAGPIAEWLQREQRGPLGWSEALARRARTSWTEWSERLRGGSDQGLEAVLDWQRDPLGSHSVDQARRRRREAVESAEREFGVNHPYTRFCRLRAVYQLYRLEAPQEAERLQCRGHLAEQLERALRELLALAAPEAPAQS